MFEVKEEREKALIISLVRKSKEKKAKIEELRELEALTKAAGAIPLEKIIQVREKPDPATYIGKGKALFLKEIDVDVLVFNEPLTPAQISNLEELTDKKVLDRQDIILDIFAQHARTKTAKIEVELAQLKFRLSRLTGRGVELSRLGGGIGTRGPGEKKLEVDRRKIYKRIDHLEKELKKIEKMRNVQRNNRREIFTVALLGYTNAGKTTLFNAITKSFAPVGDQPFVTLDPLTRSVSYPDGDKFLLVDTVGFIKGIPSEIMAAFKSTLEEAKIADLRLIVVDASSDKLKEELEETKKVMEFLGIDDSNNILVFNKIDLVVDPAILSVIQKEFPEALFISAKEKEGLRELMERIDDYKKHIRN
ncbi:MAG: GTPase HflX [candidate division WOR-3 bacterium]